MHPKFFEISKAVRPLCYSMSLSTNATLIKPATAEDIANLFDDVNVSLDDHNPARFAHFRGKRDAFEKTIAGIKSLAASGAKVVIQSVLTKESIPELWQLGQLVASLGVHTWSFRFSFSSGRQRSNANQLVTPRDALGLANQIEDIKEHFKDRIPLIVGGVNYLASFQKPYKPIENQRRLVTCAGGTILAALNAKGQLSPCTLFGNTDFHSSPVWEGGISKAWKEANCTTQMRTTMSDQIAGCGTCSNLNDGCGGGCRAKSYLAKKTILSNDYHCGYSGLVGSV